MLYERNRYNSDIYYQKWIAADKSSKTFLIEDIEVEDYDPKYADIADFFWKHISEIDNNIQDICEKLYRTWKWSRDNFIVDLAWIEFNEDGVWLGYWGRTVNVELGAGCSIIDGNWKITQTIFP